MIGCESARFSDECRAAKASKMRRTRTGAVVDSAQNRPGQPFLTVRQVATELQVDEKTVRRWIAEGVLPAVDLDSRRGGYRIRHADFTAFIAARLISAGMVGKPWRSYIAFEHHGLPERDRPRSLKGLKHEQALFAQVMAREQIVFRNRLKMQEAQNKEPKKHYFFGFRPLPRGWYNLSPIPESSPAIEAIRVTENDMLCFWCGQTPLPASSPGQTRRCTHCGYKCTYQHTRYACLRSDCSGGAGGISLGAPIESHPRSITTGRLRSAHGMAYCNNCELGWLYRWNADEQVPSITLIGWDGPGHRVSTTFAARELDKE